MMDWLDGQNSDRVAKNKAGQSDTEEVTLKAVLVRWPCYQHLWIKSHCFVKVEGQRRPERHGRGYPQGCVG
jgi:hypothetical protein